MSEWGASLTPAGKKYYWHKVTKETTWVKPEGFVDEPTAAAAQAAAAASNPADWSEARAGDGRVYYYNRVTKVTSWEKPAGFQQPRPQPDFVAGGGGSAGYQSNYVDRQVVRRGSRDHGLPNKPSFDGPRGGHGGDRWEGRDHTRHDGGGFRGPMPIKADAPEFSNLEQAEEAFFKTLRKHNVRPDTDWKDALKLVVRERDYRAIKDPADRRKAFDKYCREVREQERGQEKERREKLRVDFRQMLATHDEIKHFTRWKTARPLLEREHVFKIAGEEDEKRRMFDEYVVELRKRNSENEAQRRTNAMDQLNSMLKALVVDADTRWTDAEEIITNSERFVSEDIFQSLHKLDVFYAFESHMKSLERAANDAMQREKLFRKRRERKARDGFKQMLNEKLQEGKIKAGSKWQDLQPLIADDHRYQAYMGQLGSDPIELFWDIVEEQERRLRSKRNEAMDVMDEKRWEMTPTTQIEEFKEVMRSHARTAAFSEEEMVAVYTKIMDKVKERIEKDKYKAERDQRDIVENIRHAMRRLEPPLRADDTFDYVSQQMEKQKDFAAADNATRQTAYSKFMRRMREKEEERRDRDRERDRRDRGGTHRDHSRRSDDRGTHRHRTRTPEPDAYEADRRKAQADRVSRARRPSFGLTPPPRDLRDRRGSGPRDRRGSDHYEPRGGEPRRSVRRESVGYDRERRERDNQREKHYVSRADPRDKGRTLDYGDDDIEGSSSRPGSVRKRRDSEDMGSVVGRRESKRPRTTRSPMPDPALPKEEPKELQSGSEEGEIGEP